jgi:hypothetical protein
MTGTSAGLVVAGVGTLVVAWVLGGDFAEPTPAPWLTRVATVVVVVLLGWLAWRRRKDRVAWLATAGVAFILAVLAGWGFVDQYSRGFPGQATILAALGGLAVTIGALLFRPDNGWRRWTTVLPAFLLVPALATPLVLIAPDLRLEATTAAATEAAPVPDTVSKVAWSTAVDGPVRDIVPAGAGVVVLLDNGVVAIDGRTGDIRWTRVRHGSETERLDVSPDGATVLVQSQPGGLFPLRQEVVDAFTGRLRFTIEDTNETAPGLYVPMTNATYLTANDDESEFHGYSLTDGGRLWTYRVPSDCWVLPNTAARFAVPEGMLLPTACGRPEFTQFRYVLLDGATGRVRWQHRVRWDEPSRDVSIRATLAPDRRFVEMEVSTTNLVGPPVAQAVLDTATGTAVPAPMPLTLKSAGIATGGGPQLVDVTSGKTLPSTEASLSCVLSNHGVSLASGAVCTGRAVDSFDGLVESGRIELAVGAFTDTELRPVPVTLGGPFEKSELGYPDPIRFVATPGAVVVTTGMTPLGGKRVQVVGLR